jgi:aminomethyltransferase
LYGALLNAAGGVIDDLIVYRRERGYRLVTNAATRDQVVAWVDEVREGADVELNERADHGIIAVQGPRAIALTVAATGWDSIPKLGSFEAARFGQAMVARTGYTGEDGVEIMLPGKEATALWQDLLGVGVKPIGLGARDTLRLEAGLNLSGQDMHEGISPLIANMGWTIAWKPEERNFIGRDALADERSKGVMSKLTGVVLEGKGVIRHGNPVHTDAGIGEVTSGIFSPTLGYSIALARLPKAAKGSCEVEIRGKKISARIVKPPFVRNGKQTFE